MTATIPAPGTVLRVKVGAAWVTGRVFPSVFGRINLDLGDGGQILNVQPDDYKVIEPGTEVTQLRAEPAERQMILPSTDELIRLVERTLERTTGYLIPMTPHQVAVELVAELHYEIRRVNGGDAA